MKTLTALLPTAAVILGTTITFGAEGPARARMPGPVVAAPAARSGLTSRDRLVVFEQVWMQVRDAYYDETMRGLDWKAIRDQYRPRVAAATTDAEFYRVMSAMLGELHDPHTRFSSPDAWANHEKEQAVGLGIVVDVIEHRPVVTYVWAGSVAQAAGVVPGMIFTTIDGAPVEQRIAEARETVDTSALTIHDAEVALLSGALRRDMSAPVALGLERADGTTFEKTLTRRVVSMPSDARVAVMPSGHVYIRFDGFEPAAGEDVVAALRKFKDAPGVMLDLRHNGGGRSDVLSTIGAAFFGSGTPISRMLERADVTSLRKTRRTSAVELKTTGSGQIYKGPLVVLTAQRTASASEEFTAVVQESGRGKTVGERTCGCLVAILRPRPMKGGGMLEISEWLVLTPKNRQVEGLGLAPDQYVPVTIADLQHNRDAVFEAGEAMLQQFVHTPPVQKEQAP